MIVKTNAASPWVAIVDAYKGVVQTQYPQRVSIWPIVSGYDVMTGVLQNGWHVFFFRHTGKPATVIYTAVGELPSYAFGNLVCNEQNTEQIRSALKHHLRAKRDDGIVLIPPSGVLPDSEFKALLHDHELVMGIAGTRVFLSHRGSDKEKVRDFKKTLEALRFDPWLDEDAMVTGEQLDRAILQGMKDSCAAIFFLTPNSSDEKYLATEINYAIAEHKERTRDFAIISLVFADATGKPVVPELLRPFAWKEPSTDLEALREIIRALPIKVGEIRWQ